MKSYLEKAAKMIKRIVDCMYRPRNYKEGDMVLVKFNRLEFKALRGVLQNLVSQYEGRFKIGSQVGKISYKM